MGFVDWASVRFIDSVWWIGLGLLFQTRSSPLFFFLKKEEKRKEKVNPVSDGVDPYPVDPVVF